MLSSQPAGERDEDPFFNLIYAAAQIEDSSEAQKVLSSIFSRNPCLDLLNRQGFTPAAKLAEEGNKKAAEFLRKNGASVSRIARGAAAGGHYDYAKELYNTQGASADDLAWGAAFHGDYEGAKRFQEALGASLYSVATGAAQRGDLEEVKRLISKTIYDSMPRWPVNYTEKLHLYWRVNQFLLKGILQSAAQGGQDPKAIDAMAKGWLCYSDTGSGVAVGAALGGYFKIAEDLSVDDYHYGLIEVIKNAAQCGHITYVNEGITRYNSDRPKINMDIWGVEKSEEEKAKEIQTAVSAVAQAAAKGGHHAYAKKLYQQYCSSSSPFSLEKSTLEEMAQAAGSIGDLRSAEELYSESDFRQDAHAHLLYPTYQISSNFFVQFIQAIFFKEQSLEEVERIFRSKLIKKITNGLVENCFFMEDKRTLHALAFIQDPSFREGLITELKTRDVKLNPLLLQQAMEINSLIKLGLEYNLALFYVTLPLEAKGFILQQESTPSLLKSSLADIKIISLSISYCIDDNRPIPSSQDMEKIVQTVLIEQQSKEALNRLHQIKSQIKDKKTWHAFFRGKIQTPLGSAQKILTLIQEAEEGKKSYLNAQSEIKAILEKTQSDGKRNRTQLTSLFYQSLLDIIEGTNEENTLSDERSSASSHKKQKK